MTGEEVASAIGGWALVCVTRRRDGVPGSGLWAEARRRWAGAGWRGEEVAKREARPEDSREDKI